MNARVFLDEASALEDTMSALYEALSKIATDKELSAEFRRLHEDEAKHSRVIQTGKNYLRQAPGLFGETIITEQELMAGQAATGALLKDVREGNVNLREALVRLRKLEDEYEKIHMATVMAIKDDALRNMFHLMAKDDQDHRQTLDEIMKKLG